MRFVIHSEPIPQQRPRFGRRGNVYDPCAQYKKMITRSLQSRLTRAFEGDNERDLQEASRLANGDHFDVEMIFYMPCPKSFTKTQKNLVSWGFLFDQSKKDLDNLVKFILDCGNKLFYMDDHQVTSITAKKVYSHHPRTEIIVIPHEKLDSKTEKILASCSVTELNEIIECAEQLKLCLSDASKYPHPKLLREFAYRISEMAALTSPVAKNVTKACPTYVDDYISAKKHLTQDES